VPIVTVPEVMAVTNGPYAQMVGAALGFQLPAVAQSPPPTPPIHVYVPHQATLAVPRANRIAMQCFIEASDAGMVGRITRQSAVIT
jgi:hypothetical protein